MLKGTGPQTVSGEINWMPSMNRAVYSLQEDDLTILSKPKLTYYVEVTINGALITKLRYPVYTQQPIYFNLCKVLNDYLSDHWSNEDTQPDQNAPSPETLELSLNAWDEYFDTNTNTYVFANQCFYFVKTVWHYWRAAADWQNDHTNKLEVYARRFEVQNYPVNSYDDLPLPLGTHCISPYPNQINTNLPSYLGTNQDKRFFDYAYPISPLNQRSFTCFRYTDKYISCAVYDAYYEVICFDKDHNIVLELAKKCGLRTYTYPNKEITAPVGVTELNNIAWDIVQQYNGYTLSVIDPTIVKYYAVYWCEKPPQGYGFAWNICMTKELLFEIKPCSRYDSYNILYKSVDGGWWQVRVNMKHHKSTEIKSSTMKNSWKNEVHNDTRFVQSTAINANGTWIVNTDWLSMQGMIDDVEDMIQSPELYLVQDTVDGPVYTPVVLNNSTYDIYEKEQDKMVQYEFELDEAFDKYTLIGR